MTDLWYGTSGPHDAKVVIVGESWGSEERDAQRPFVGNAGTELNRMLAEAGIKRDDVLCTNVISEKPNGNEMWRFFAPAAVADVSHRLGGLDPLPNVRAGIRRLYDQISTTPRSLIIALGNYALWALAPNCVSVEKIRESQGRRIPPDAQPLVPSGIGNWRGSMWYTETSDVPRTPLLPAYHPAGIMRQWAWRAVTVHDLRTRTRQALDGDWRPAVAPIFWAPPTFEQCISRLNLWLAIANSGNQEVWLAEDIETARGQITCLGLSDDPDFAMCIPFIRRREDNDGFDSWWPAEQEAQIVYLLRRVNAHPKVRIIGQNFIYDTQYIQLHHGVTPKLDFDTMLAQNVLFPGTPKTLEYLSSLYCRHHWYWKEDHKEWNMRGTIADLLLYNCLDCIRTWEVAMAQRRLIAHLGMEAQWRIKMQTNDLCLRMMNRGVRIDGQRRAQLAVQLGDSLEALHHELTYIVPQEFSDPDYAVNKAKRGSRYVYWYKSDKQSKTILNDVLGLPRIASRKTGNPTSGKEARLTWSKQHPEWRGLLDRLTLYESADNTLHVLNAGLDPDGRMRCSFNPGGTETHRLSSSKNAFGRGTNLQNLTKGKEDI